MAKAKVARKSTAIDMTPMVDLAFLLITFFMLTVKFRPSEAVEVTMPTSIATTPLPEKDVMIISVSKDSKVFMRLSSQQAREALLEKMLEKKKAELNFTEADKKKFKVCDDFGGSYSQIKQFVNTDAENRKKLIDKPEFKGIPIDTVDNQLDAWVLAARMTNPQMRIAIKADQDTPYPVIDEVVKVLKKRKAHKFNLITSKEADPRLGGEKR